MDENQYHSLLDTLMLTLEECIDGQGLDIDYETQGGVMTLICDNGSQVILTRQTPLKQLWLAAKSGGYHFVFDETEQAWLLEGGSESFTDMLNRCLSEQSGETICFTL